MRAVPAPTPPDLLDAEPLRALASLDDLDLGVFEYDLVRGEQRFSATCKRLWGLRAADAATPERIAALIHPEDRHALAVAYASLRPDGAGHFAVEHRIVRPDGAVRWLQVRGRTIFDDAGAERRAIRSVGTMQDVTDLRVRPADRRTAEARHAFMMTLEDRLRPLSSPKQIQFEAARLLARGLAVERVGYGEDGGDGETVRITSGYADASSALRGTFRYADFGADVPQRFRGGRMVIVADAQQDATLTDAMRRAYAAIGVAATINVPLVKNGRLVAVLFVHAARARTWTAEELALVEAVAHRTWDAVERARAERLARRAARELRARSERLRLFIEHAPAAIAMLDREMRCLAVSRRFAESFGLQSESIVGRAIPEFFPDAPAGWRDAHAKCLVGETVSVEAEPFARHGGETLWLKWELRPWYTRRATIGGVLLFVEDVTDRQRYESRLRESAARLRLAFEAAGMSPWRADLRANRFEASEGAVALHGLAMTEHAWTVERAAEVIHPADRPHVYETLARAARDGTSCQIEYRTVWPNGTVKWVANAARGELDERGRATGRIHGTVRDVSARREAIERIAASEARLQRAHREKDRFLATLSHELRNPLAPIRTAAQVLASPRIRDDQLTWARQVIQRQVGHMALLLDDLLDVARITQGKLSLKKERVTLSDVVDASVETARPLLDRKNHHFTVSLPVHAPTLDADPLRLAQVLSNLLTNAAKYTDPGGHVALRASVHERELRVEVQDDGIGIDPAAMEHLFEMFAQAPGESARAEGGLGIGLALVKGLVELHGGTIRAQSAGPGRGTTFHVTLPLPAAEPAATPGAATHADPPSARRARVLVVDDNRDGADSLALLLELHGHDVRVAYGGRSALALATTFRPEIAFVDLGMPDLDGCAVARELRSRPEGEGMRLIALTGWGQDADKQRTEEAGFDAHLTKPIDPERIATLLVGGGTPR